MQSTIALHRPCRFVERGGAIPLSGAGVWQVCQGWVQLSTWVAMGEERVLGWVGPSMWFGSGLTTRAHHQARALSDVMVVWYAQPEIENTPELGLKLLQQKARRLCQLEELLAIASQRRALDRLSNLFRLLIFEMGQLTAEGVRLEARLTHQEIASAIGTNRVTVTRMLGELKRQGIVVLDGHKHWIVKKPEFFEQNSALSYMRA
ncbi:cAMP-binding protein - catabolite activator and regulatory subunit of cAMP-dependent protein kinase [Geitlerinema sp. FC II]|nr:Crp/Fnr family transcriptional regulator [Geitlerinema sp. CS-897]PPT05052.1 cAMP-binding protein - catabolite activator and regulatory subunit of cAMP-dependent protein kinase [Geitlerinema sp. FC II]